MTSIYRVLLDGQLMSETEHELAAWATYRATLRRGDLREQRPVVVIERDGELLHSAACDGRASAIDVGTIATPNTVLKSLMASRLRESDVREAARVMGYPVSGSRIQGWLAAPGNRRYQAMTLDELAVIVAGLNEGADA